MDDAKRIARKALEYGDQFIPTPYIVNTVADLISSYGEACRRAGAEAMREAAAELVYAALSSMMGGGRFIVELKQRILALALPSAAEAALPATGWRTDMDAAPRDKTLIALLCRYEPGDDCGNALEDADIAPTIGFWQEDGGWAMAGWDWCQDVFRDGNGSPIAWAPFLSAPSEEANKAP